MQRLSKILDAQGQPIKVSEAIREEQTSRIGFIATEFENHPTSGLTPAKVARILINAERGDLIEQLDMFEDMEEKDAHISCELGKRKRALLGLDWKLMPPRNPISAEEAAAEAATEWLQDMDDFEDYLFDMADAIGKGFSMLEMTWLEQSGLMLPQLKHQPARWFTIDEHDRNKLLLRDMSANGEELWPFGWVQHVHKSKSGYVSRSGLHRVLVWPYMFKNYSIRDLAEFLEIYGIPARLGTYSNGASEEEKATLLRAVISVGHNAAGIMPEGMKMEFKEAAQGQSDPFQAMIAWCESSQSKAILGGTLTTSAENTGLGSNQADVHNEVRHDLLNSDARQLAGTLSRDLIWPMIALNIPGIDPNRAPRFKFITEEEEDITKRAERDKLLFDMGYRMTPEKVTEVYGEGYTVIETPPPVPPTESTAEQAATAAAKVGDNNSEIDGFVTELAKQTQPSIDSLLDRIKQLLNEVESIEEFQDRLIEAYSYLEPDDLGDIIQMGMAAAELAGRYEVSEDG